MFASRTNCPLHDEGKNDDDACRPKRSQLITSFMYHSHSLHLLRKRWALSQQELADLLSISRSALVRLESGVESIRLVTAHALLVVFGNGEEIRQTDIYLQVDEAVMNRAATLDARLRHKSDAASLRKLELLSDMVRRASGRFSGL